MRKNCRELVEGREYQCGRCGEFKKASGFYLTHRATHKSVTSECRACRKRRIERAKANRNPQSGLLALHPLPYKVVGGTRRCANVVYAYAQQIAVEVTKEPHGVMIHRPKGEVRPNTLGIFDNRVDPLTLRFLFA